MAVETHIEDEEEQAIASFYGADGRLANFMISPALSTQSDKGNYGSSWVSQEIIASQPSNWRNQAPGVWKTDELLQ